MEECRYRKLRCNLGHETKPYPEGMVLPRRCPVCNQPYDRINNKAIPCYEDGSVPGETIDEMKTEEIPIPEVHIEPEEPQIEYGIPERGRRGRRAISNVTERATEQPWYARSNVAAPNTGIRKSVLYGGGERIEVSEYGACLGREELGRDYFYMNQLVSRKHAFVKADNGGNIQVRDAESLNGTYVDDGSGRRRLKAGETVVLNVGSRIWIANQMLIVEEDDR